MGGNDNLLQRTLLNAHRICREKRYVYLSELEEKEKKMPDAIFSIMQSPEGKKIFSAGNDSRGTFYYMKRGYAAMTYSEVVAVINAIVIAGLQDMLNYLDMSEEKKYEYYKKNKIK